MPVDAARTQANLAAIRQRIASAARRAGRSADDVRLVAVTKYVGPGEAAALVAGAGAITHASAIKNSRSHRLREWVCFMPAMRPA